MTAPEIVEPLVIQGTIQEYPIEPARFEHGFSRVEMVDFYLVDLIRGHRRHSTDMDVLLDARNMLKGTE